MQIVYDPKIIYEPERFEYVEHQKLIANVAILLLSAKGSITLIEPNGIKIKYDFNSGEVTLESQIGNVNNTFSDLEVPITQPVKQAISRIATFELLKRIATLSNDAITSIINKNHPHLDNPQENMHMLNATLIAINKLMNFSEKHRPLLAVFTLFKMELSKPALKTENVKSSSAIEALLNDKIHSIEDVEKILPSASLKISR